MPHNTVSITAQHGVKALKTLTMYLQDLTRFYFPFRTTSTPFPWNSPGYLSFLP